LPTGGVRLEKAARNPVLVAGSGIERRPNAPNIDVESYGTGGSKNSLACG